MDTNVTEQYSITSRNSRHVVPIYVIRSLICFIKNCNCILQKPTLPQAEFTRAIQEEKRYFQCLLDELYKASFSCGPFGIMPVMNSDDEKVIATNVEENSSFSSEVETLMSATAPSTHNEVSVFVVDLGDMICYMI